MSQSEQLPETVPRHVAIIMDGNGRWAQRRGLPRIEGHRRGVKSVRAMVEAGADLGLEQLTLFCLSSENWKRPESELRRLMNLLEQFLVEERSTIMREGLRFATIGRREGLSDGVLKEIDKTVRMSSENTGMRLCLALNYGARREIADATIEIARKVQTGELRLDEIDEGTVSDHLYTAGMPDPDLLIRTAGELRISNYLLWQISYAELWVTEKFWPEFRRPDLIEAFHAFASRDRRYGGLKG
ncbi:MAG: polyprenyl diphosphate synthase [Planctomycetales bacterium]|jgi:undecaprenyl diphosphate synthase